MDSRHEPSRRLVRSLAFLERAFILRPLGRMGRWGEDTERRASAWLEALSNPSKKLAFLVKVENLTREFNLFIVEEALNDTCLRLQVRAFELAPDYPSLSDRYEEVLSKSPISKLMSAIIRQACKDGMDAILIDLDSNQIQTDGAIPERTVEVSFRKGEEWQMAMSIPSNLGPPILGFTFRMQAIGYDRIRPFMWHGDKMPEHLEIDIPKSGKNSFNFA